MSSEYVRTYGTRSKRVNALCTYCDATCGTNTVKFTHVRMYVNKSTYIRSRAYVRMEFGTFNGCPCTNVVHMCVVSLIHRYLFVNHTGEKAGQQVEYQLPGRTGS